MSVVILVIDRIGRLNTNNHTYNDIHVTIIVEANHGSGFYRRVCVIQTKYISIMFLCFSSDLSLIYH